MGNQQANFLTAIDEVAREYPGTPIEAQVPDELRAVADGNRIGGVVRELLEAGPRQPAATRVPACGERT